MKVPVKSGGHALLFIVIVLIIDTVGFGITVPVMPKLITGLTGEPLSSAVVYGGWLLFIYALMQFLFSPVIGNLSDRFGRRGVLLISLAALAIDYLIMATAPSIFWLFVGRTIAGIAGATTATASAYIADVTPPEERARGFGLVGAAWSLGFTVGPAIGGLLGEIGPRVPFYGAAALAAANLVYGLVVLQESLPAEKRRPFVLWRANPLGALVSMRRYPVVIGIFIAAVFYIVAHDVYPATWTYFVLLKFDWSQAEIGIALALVGLSGALVSGVLTGHIVKRLGEAGAAYLGLVSSIIGFLGFALVSQGWMMYPFIVIAALMGLVSPALRSIASRAVADTEQGELQGALSSLNGLVAIAAPLILTETFHFFTAHAAPIYFPGAAFLLGAILLAATLVVIMRLSARTRPAPAE
jgi:DHA1 family tetracycline resistance protein-like MFS transporter